MAQSASFRKLMRDQAKLWKASRKVNNMFDKSVHNKKNKKKK